MEDGADFPVFIMKVYGVNMSTGVFMCLEQALIVQPSLSCGRMDCQQWCCWRSFCPFKPPKRAVSLWCTGSHTFYLFISFVGQGALKVFKCTARYLETVQVTDIMFLLFADDSAFLASGNCCWIVWWWWAPVGASLDLWKTHKLFQLHRFMTHMSWNSVCPPNFVCF